MAPLSSEQDLIWQAKGKQQAGEPQSALPGLTEVHSSSCF